MNHRLVCFGLISCVTLALFVPPSLSAQQDDATPAEIESPLAVPPETPAELFDAVVLMMVIDRPNLAQQYLRRLLDAEMDAETLLQLRDKHGTAAFLELTRNEALQPEANELLQRVNDAASSQLNNPAYLDGVVNQLEGSPRNRESAVTALKFLGPQAVPLLLGRIADIGREDQHELLIYTLTRLGDEAVAPLRAALESDQPRIRAIAANVLGWIGSESDVPFLWHDAYAEASPGDVKQAAQEAISRIRFKRPDRTGAINSDRAAEQLEKTALNEFAKGPAAASAESGQVDVWQWDSDQNNVVLTKMTPQQAQNHRGIQLAQDALALAPSRESAQVLYLGLLLADAVDRANWQRPIAHGAGSVHELAVAGGSDILEQTVALALEHDNMAAALGAVDLLAVNGDRNLLQATADGRPPLVLALDAPDDRVQFAAAATVLQLDPHEPFAGSSRVVPILARELGGTTQPATVVIDPNTERATAVASRISTLGLEPTVVRTGRAGFTHAATRGNIELAAIHLNSIRWELTDTIANLRADSRTASIPIVVYGVGANRPSVQRLASRYSDVLLVNTSGETNEIARLAKPFIAQAGTPPASPQAQKARIAEAAAWLSHIATRRLTHLFALSKAQPVLVESLGDPDVALDALYALAAVPTPEVQSQLWNLADAPGANMPLRIAGANQLAFHIQQFGLMLTSEQIAKVHIAWDQATDDRLRAAYAAVIGSMHPTPEAVSNRLSTF